MQYWKQTKNRIAKSFSVLEINPRQVFDDVIDE